MIDTLHIMAGVAEDVLAHLRHCCCLMELFTLLCSCLQLLL